jgi:hypothetical protein
VTPLPTVFTHDHFGPSTHQQTGLYAGLLPEDDSTTWRDPETGTVYGTRTDGGPTSWRADILYPGSRRNYREFGIQIADFSLAYGKEGFRAQPRFDTEVDEYAYWHGPIISRKLPPINPPGRFEVDLPDLLRPPLADACPNGSAPPCPEIVSSEDPGTMLINYRNEPLALRVRDPAPNEQAPDSAGDLSLAYSTAVARAQDSLNVVGPYGTRPGVLARDPFTPMMRTYEDDRILVRLLVGAHEEGHNWGINGTRWLHERLSPNSGFRGSQMAGISEWHEFELNPLMTNRKDTIADYAYRGGSAVDDQWNGTWGVIRAYRKEQGNLLRLDTTRAVSVSLAAAKADSAAGRVPEPDGADAFNAKTEFPDPNDPDSWEGDLATLDAASTTGAKAVDGLSAPVQDDSLQAGFGRQSAGGIDYDYYEYDPDAGTETVVTTDSTASTKGLTAVSSGSSEFHSSPTFARRGFWGVCPRIAPLRVFEVSAIPASSLPDGRLVYNTRTGNGGPLNDPTAVVYVYDGDLKEGQLLHNPEPLILRANAGDCVLVRLRNRLPEELPDSAGWNTYPMIVDLFNANQVRPSARVGLHAQLVALDVQRSDGSMVGINRNTTVAPGRWRWYQWYAGTVYPTGVGHKLRATPVEFGAANLQSSDHVEHASKGAIGALIVEPRKTDHDVDPLNRAYAVIRRAGRNQVLFREGVLLWQDDLNLRFGSGTSLRRFDCADIEGGSEEDEGCATVDSGVEDFAAGEAVPNLAESEDPEDSGQKGLNYRTEPLWFRKGFAPDAELGFTRNLDFRDVLTGDSAQTPIFRFAAGDSIRIRVVEPGGHARNHVFNLHGHVWEEEPYADSSRVIAHNPFSEWKGTREGHGPGEHFDIVPRNGAGGTAGITGDFLLRDQASFQFDGGIWAVVRVVPNTKGTELEGSFCTIDANTGQTTCS